MKIEKISYTSWKDFNKCNYYYKLKHIDKIRIPFVGTIYTAFGKSIHHCLEVGLISKTNKERAYEIFEKYFEEDIKKEKIIVPDMLEWKEKGKKTIYNFWDKNFKKLFNKIYNVEWKFNIPLYDGKFRITGIIDHITNTKNDNWGIIDWKTGKYKKPNEESEMQLSFYSVAIEKQFNKIPEWFCLHYIEHDKTNFSFRNKEKNKETEEQLIRFYNLIGDMQENDFKPNFKSCNRFCDFKNTCKYIIGEDGCGQIR